MNTILRTRYAVRIVGSNDALIPYDLKYCWAALGCLSVHAELVRIDHIESDYATTGRNWTYEYTVVKSVNVPAGTTALPALWIETNVRKTARECTPGTVVWLATPGTIHGPGWKRITVARWEGQGNGYASLFSTDGNHCGQFLADELLECEV